MKPYVVCCFFMLTLMTTIAYVSSINSVLDKGDEGLQHLKNISSQKNWVTEEVLTRVSRLINNKEINYWPKAIVPYVVKQDVMNEKPEYLKVMGVYEANTCIRFVPWNESVGEIYGLGHQGHLNFIKSGGCYVFSTSVQRDISGQVISCCSNEACLHEIGHSLGFAHEQDNPLRAGWTRMNTKNIFPNNRNVYTLTSNPDYLGSNQFPYDISSAMHYKPWVRAFGTGGMTMLFPELQFKVSHFNQFKELALSYKCNQYSPCNGKQLGCVNDGYTSIVYGKCQCVCPEGLDPASLCAKPLHKVTMTWPKGQYSLPMPKTGCPDKQFETGSVNLNGITKDRNSGETVSIKQEFCTRNTKDYSFTTQEEEKWNWPLGNYCIYKVGDQCPFGFSPGSVSFGQAWADNVAGQLPSGQFNKSVTIEFCCQYRGFTWNPSYLPTDQPFSVVKLTGACQDVTGMNFKEERVTYYGKGFTSDGSVPNLDFSKTKFSMTLCHYTPTDMKCGDGIVLDNDHRETTIIFSGEGKTDLECTWVVSGDDSSGTLVLDFEEMNVKMNGDKCMDKIEVKHALIGQTGLEYCGESVGHSIRSITSRMIIRFFTSGQSASSFKARVKWVPNEDLCYDTNDRGISYNGHVNYTRLFEPCLPWAQVSQCYHNPFLEGERRENLDGNYCRNPDNSFRPWCYTNVTDCQRNYCDVCGLEKAYDRFHNCSKLKEAGWCTMDANIAAKYCPATCNELISPSNKQIQKYGDIKCGIPNPPTDGNIIGETKSSYYLGERVQYKCKTGESVFFSTCLTSGDWSPVPYVCLACPIGSIAYGESCYMLSGNNGANSYKDADDICANVGGVIPAPRDIDENNVVRSASGNQNTWIGINDIKTEETWVYGDGSKMTWDNWNDVEPNNLYSGEDCAAVDSKGGWMDVPCSGYRYKVVCKIKKGNVSDCYDFLGDRCGNILGDNSNMCSSFPEYARTFCRKTCGLCEVNHGKCSVEIPNTNVEILAPVMSQESISVGEAVVYGCMKYTFKHEGDEIRSCLPDGRLTGQPLQCGECPLGYVSGKYACHGVIPGQLLTFAEANEECRKVGGYVAMSKSQDDNDIISTVAFGDKVWLGATLQKKEGLSVWTWEDDSLVYWKREKGNQASDGDDCVVLDGERKWNYLKCGPIAKYSTVCTVPKYDNYACFDVSDKGVTYNGKVNVTSSNTPCLSWAETTECNINVWNVEESLHNLDNNYCRNPNNNERPWCYISGCNWEYCDVCNSQRLKKDNSINCGTQRDNSVCTKDVTKASSECAGTCSDLLPDSGRVYYRQVKCQKPNNPSNSVIVSKIRSEYHIGDIVSLKCKNNKFVVNVTCLSDGEWSQAGIICSECPIGYTQRGDKCYRFYDQKLTQKQAREKCATFGGFLPRPKSMEEDQVLKSFTHGKYTWIGAKRKDDSESFVWEDGSQVSWSNWAKDYPRSYSCVLMNNLGEWGDTECDFIQPDIRLVCVVPKQIIQTCSDFLDRQCPKLLTERPAMCGDQDFANGYCAKTCGICGADDVTCDISTETDQSFVTLLNKTRLHVGKTISYECKADMIQVKGDSIRMCQNNGVLSGTQIVCKDVSSLNTVLVGASELVNGNKVIPFINVFFGDNDLYGIKDAGFIIAWEYFSDSSIKMAFQVWRNVQGVNYRLIGQNVLTTGQGKRERYDVPTGHRIKVQPGDVIGIVNSAAGGVKFKDCDNKQHPNWTKLRWSDKIPSLTSFSIGDHHKFNQGENACILFPMRAIVAVTK